MTQTLDASGIVFVYGALRSGTTVFRLMLDAHPDIANPGEMDYLFDYIRPDPSHPTGWRYDIDNLLMDRIYQHHAVPIPQGVDGLDLLQHFLDTLRRENKEKVFSINIHRHLDRIVATLPDALFIHMLRDPRDVARSSIVMGWAGTTYHAVGHWMETEEAWDSGLGNKAPDTVMTLQYETLFRDTENTLRQVCEFLKLPYTDDLMSYHEGTTYDAPDPSLVQQWRKRAKPYDIALIEARAGALMEDRGYPKEVAPVDLNAMTLAKLVISNKLAVWRFGMKRHGAATFFLEKATRWMSLRPLHRRLRQQMNNNDARSVK